MPSSTLRKNRSNAPGGASSSSTTPTLPAWARAIQEREQQQRLNQPWKATFSGAEYKDDPNFAEGSDPVMFYDGRVKVCFGESTMAA
ncbi:hypothetical protein QBC47DRAFT_407317 [Echria macrotheca]|uniref:Uncharacterized protein n=1 Tax=Echria macrotheca TaxID=438768 RepID=A0AAJ0F6D6_9PEZI|nr:hypothetical protein QBC47DRAFT_407317 [Echria macrotheca]